MDPLIAAEIHDIKNTLFALSNRLFDQPSPSCTELANELEQLAERLTRLLTLSRARSGQLQPSLEDVYLPTFLVDLQTHLTPLIPSSLTHTISSAPGLPTIWTFDPRLLTLALIEAVRNAARFARTRIDLTAAPFPPRMLAFTIHDDGPGFPPEILATGCAAAPSPGSPHTHLGLALITAIVESHTSPAGRGRLLLENREGAQITLILP